MSLKDIIINRMTTENRIDLLRQIVSESPKYLNAQLEGDDEKQWIKFFRTEENKPNKSAWLHLENNYSFEDGNANFMMLEAIEKEGRKWIISNDEDGTYEIEIYSCGEFRGFYDHGITISEAITRAFIEIFKQINKKNEL